MDKLNKKQRIAVWILLALAVGMFLVPPKHVMSGDRSLDAGYIWIGVTRTVIPGRVYEDDITINNSRLLIQYVLLAGIGWVVVTSLKSKSE